MALALIFNTFRSVKFIVLVFTSIRFFAGGVHMDTYARCLVITLAAFVPVSLISKHFCNVLSGLNGYLLVLFVLTLSLLIFIRWAPKNPPGNQVSEKANSRLKMSAIVLLIIWSAASVCLLILKKNEAATAISFGILIEVSTVAPAEL